MDDLKKAFVCQIEKCNASFTNADHLEVHTKGHSDPAMVLQFGLCGKPTLFEVDQTPTPTRLIRNCDEVGLFDDLHLHQVNPFDETFRRAVETKGRDDYSKQLPANEEHKSSLIVEDSLHTPCVLPLSQNPCSGSILPPPITSDDATKCNSTIETNESSNQEISPKISSKTRGKRKSEIPIASGTQKFRKVLPKIVNVSSKQPLVVSKSVSPLPSKRDIKEPTELLKAVCVILKEQILKGKTTASRENVKKAAAPVYVPSPLVKRKLDYPEEDEAQQRYERNKEASKRYRNKQKLTNKEQLLRNAKLEEENKRLREELRQVEGILQAHQQFPVNNAFPPGLNIPIGQSRVNPKCTKPPSHPKQQK